MADSSLNISPKVAEALLHKGPVVALESTIISHGLPRPRNLAAARDFEDLLESQGVVPATIAVIRGTPTVGLSPEELELI
ncbi:MAG: pseudouridine-5'-phosphate glycosidase, partial [Aquiluna sp.]